MFDIKIMERTIKFQEAGNKALLQRMPVMPVSPEPVNPHVLQLLATYVLRREDLTRGSLISGGFHHIHVPFPPIRDADGVAVDKASHGEIN